MNKKEEVQAVRLEGPVRITIPADVAYNLDSLSKSITAAMERLGCGKCFSGADCTFRMARDLIIDGPQAVRTTARLLDPGPDGEPAVRAGRAVTVSLTKEVSHSLDRVLGAVKTVVGKLGCGACCSGFDIAFREEFRFLTVDKNLDVQSFGQPL